MQNKDVVILIPTLNEVETIGRTVEDILKWVPGCRPLVIDSYSVDGTAGVARSAGATVVFAPKGGKGVAVRSVLPEILSEYPCKWFVMLDGDATYPAKHIPEVLAELDDGADVVLGYRDVRERGSMTRTNIIGNYGLSLLASVLYGKRVRDVCTGLWGFRREALERFMITSNKFTLEADLFVNAMRNRCRIKQIPIEYRARPEGSNSKLSMKDGLEIGGFLVKSRFRGLNV